MKHLVAATIVVSMTLGLAASSSANTDLVNALVVGKVVHCAGPAPGRCSLQKDAEISVYGFRHRLVAREDVSNGHFAFLLRAGRFRLVSECVAFGEDRCPGSRSVTAKAHKTVHVTIVEQIR